MFRNITVYAAAAALALCLTPVRSTAADKTILELQRDVASLQEQVRQLKESQDQQLKALTDLVQQALATSKSQNSSVAGLQSNLQTTLKDIEGRVTQPSAQIMTRLDAIEGDVRTVQQSVTDLNSLNGKIQQQLTDLNNAIKVLQTPAPPPPPAGGSSSNSGGGSAGSVIEAPTMSASDLYGNANRDRTGNKYDIAIQEYTDYLRWYGNTDLAPNAQFYIGVIHYNQGRFDDAINDFDVVLEKYSENPKTPDALYQKGLALQKLGRLTDSRPEFQELIKRYPKTDLAIQACDKLKGMGYNCGTPAAPKSAPAKKKKLL